MSHSLFINGGLIVNKCVYCPTNADTQTIFALSYILVSREETRVSILFSYFETGGDCVKFLLLPLQPIDPVNAVGTGCCLGYLMAI